MARSITCTVCMLLVINLVSSFPFGTQWPYGDRIKSENLQNSPLTEISDCFNIRCPSGTTGCRKYEKSEDNNFAVVRVTVECIGRHGALLDQNVSTKSNPYGAEVKVNNYVYRGGYSGENNSRPFT